MGFFGFGSKKLEESSKINIIKAYEQVAKGTFEGLYLKVGATDYKKHDFKSQDDYVQYLMEARVEEFVQKNNFLSVVIASSEKWHEMYKGKVDRSVLDALETFVALEYNIKNKRYNIRKMGVYYYPESIIYETEEKTKQHYLRQLNKLKTLN